MSEKQLKAKTKEINEKNIKELIEKHMGRPYEKIDIREISISRLHEKIARDVRIAIAKWIQKEFEEIGELDDFHFKAAITAGLVGAGAEP